MKLGIDQESRNTIYIKYTKWRKLERIVLFISIHDKTNYFSKDSDKMFLETL